jgi:predicted amidohydrolase
VGVGVAIAQVPVNFSVPANVTTILDVMAAASPADIVVTPEGSLTGYLVNGPASLDRLKATDQSEVEEALGMLGREAKQRGVHVWIGICQQRDGVWTNEAVGLLADGTQLVYRKVNLATAERGVFRAGDELPVFEFPVAAHRIAVGVQLCRELRFPEQWRSLAERGAQLFLHLNHGQADDTEFETWRAMLIARAAENQRFLASANAASSAQHSPSVVVGADGSVLAELPKGESVVQRVELDIDRTEERYLGQRRRDLGL